MIKGGGRDDRRIFPFFLSHPNVYGEEERKADSPWTLYRIHVWAGGADVARGHLVGVGLGGLRVEKGAGRNHLKEGERQTQGCLGLFSTYTGLAGSDH